MAYDIFLRFPRQVISYHPFMAASVDDSPSPGRNDTQGTVDDLSATLNPSSDYSLKTETPGHQGVKTAGGSYPNLRVLECAQISSTFDYDTIFEKFKSFGVIQRIKMVFNRKRNFYNLYITFTDSDGASSAYHFLTENESNFGRCKIISVNNLEDDKFDFVPDYSVPVEEEKERILPLPTWHVASYKEGRENLIRGAETIQKKVGNIPRGHLKRYGKALLIKAGNETQAALLSNFKPSTDGNIKSISPHKSFNTFKGIVYSKDLHEYEDWEILEKCPPSVFKAQKLKGDNHAILLTFTSSFIPDIINLEHTRIKVKKYYRRPTQCFKCFEYGHGYDKCKNERKCSHCSENHEPVQHCANNMHCFLCDGDHSPKSRNCPRYQFEQEVLDVANNQYISIGSAKQVVMGANKTPNSSYAKVIKAMKVSSFRARREVPTTKAPVSAPQGDMPSERDPESVSQKEAPTPKAPEIKSKPSSNNHSGGTRPKTSKQSETKERHNPPKSSVANTPKEKSSKKEASSKKTSRDDSDSNDGFVPTKRIKSYRSSENVPMAVEVSNSFSVLASLEGQPDITEKPQRTRSVEDIPASLKQAEAKSAKGDKSSLICSLPKPSIPSGTRVKILNFNNALQCQSSGKDAPAGKQD